MYRELGYLGQSPVVQIWVGRTLFRMRWLHGWIKPHEWMSEVCFSCTTTCGSPFHACPKNPKTLGLLCLCTLLHSLSWFIGLFYSSNMNISQPWLIWQVPKIIKIILLILIPFSFILNCGSAYQDGKQNVSINHHFKIIALFSF
jgi:hypothetical protein